MKKFILFVVIFSQFQVIAQKETNIWYFGIHAGLDFNSGSPVALTDGQLDTREGCASICDENGALLLYTDGVTVYDKSHSIMENGTGLLGDSSSTNSAIIIPRPESTTEYYIVTALPPSEGTGLHYSTVDMSLNGGVGAITSEKNIVLIDAFVSERLSAVKHRNNKDYWFVAQETYTATIKAFKVTNQGVDLTPVISNVTDEFGAQGVFKFSPDGTKLAMATSGGVVQLFNFNNSTGEVYNPRYLVKIDKSIDDDVHYYGVEFSPNGKLLYCSEQDTHVYQFNLEAGSIEDIRNSKLVLSTTLSYGPHNYGTLQLGPDGKIYVAKTNGEYLDLIEYPDILGTGCSYVENGIYLEGKISHLGLPPFIQSFFYTSFSFENLCFGDATQFNIADDIDKATWNFGDPSSGSENISNLKNPTHIFSSPGTYNVSLSAIKNGESAFYESEVTIYEMPTANQPNLITFCDVDNDGFYLYDLTHQNASILNGQNPESFELVYYEGLQNFNNDIPIESPSTYTNSNSFTHEIIYVKVFNKKNSNCFAKTQFDYQVYESPEPNTTISKLSECDSDTVGTDLDGRVLFDLTLKEHEIVNNNDASLFEFHYYNDASCTSEIISPKSYSNTLMNEVVYVKINNKLHPSCEEFAQFEIEVFEKPIINSHVELKQCDDDNDGFSLFNLKEVTSKVLTNQSDSILFYKSYEGASKKLSDEEILDHSNYTNNTVSTSKVWARVENEFGCHRVAEIDLIVATTLIPYEFNFSFYQCDADNDGVETFDLTEVRKAVLDLFPQGQLPIVSFYQNLNDALSELNTIEDISNYQNFASPNYQELYVRVDSELDNSCLGLGNHVFLTVERTPIANEVQIPIECDPDGDGMYEFDTSYIQESLIGNQVNVEVFYYDDLGNQLPSPLPNPFLIATQNITARIENSTSLDPNGKCFDETILFFKVEAAVVAHPVKTIFVCDDDFDGLGYFDTSQIETEILKDQEGMIVEFYDEKGNELSSPLPNPFHTSSISVTARVINPINEICFDETSFDLVVLDKPYFELEKEGTICMTDNSSLLIEVKKPRDKYDYLWFNAAGDYLGDDFFLDVSQGGYYSVIAFSEYGCESSEIEIFVIESEIAKITHEMITVIDDSSNNSIAIDISSLGIGMYEFSLDDVEYQDEPYFENLQSGIYTVFIRDKYGCGISQIEVSVIGYPKFFTPNNDGFNDYWNVKGVNENFYSNSQVNIFDRFGKLIAKIDPLSSGWNGTYNGEKMPATDYWFSVELKDVNGISKIRKGHFSLVR